MRARFVAVVLLLLPLAAPAAWAADEEVRTIPARRGVTESFLLLRPAYPSSRAATAISR